MLYPNPCGPEQVSHFIIYIFTLDHIIIQTTSFFFFGFVFPSYVVAPHTGILLPITGESTDVPYNHLDEIPGDIYK